MVDFEPKHFYYSPKTLKINSSYIRFFAYKKVEIKEYSNWEETLVSRLTPQFNTLYIVFITKEIELDDDNNSKKEDEDLNIDIQHICIGKDLNEIMRKITNYVKKNDVELLSNLEK